MRAEIENLVNNAKNGIFTQRDLINVLLKVIPRPMSIVQARYTIKYTLTKKGGKWMNLLHVHFIILKFDK